MVHNLDTEQKPIHVVSLHTEIAPCKIFPHFDVNIRHFGHSKMWTL